MLAAATVAKAVERGVLGCSKPRSIGDKNGVFMRERGLRELQLERVSTSLNAASSEESACSTARPSSSRGLPPPPPPDPESDPLLLEEVSVQPVLDEDILSDIQSAMVLSSSWLRRTLKRAGVDPVGSASGGIMLAKSSGLSRLCKPVGVRLFQGRISPSVAAATSMTWSPAAKLTPLSSRGMSSADGDLILEAARITPPPATTAAAAASTICARWPPPIDVRTRPVRMSPAIGAAAATECLSRSTAKLT
mmetsp:Transcript_135054/g.431550  ORF Transcript_135054/g.431550 Transcript_135054/m.431550 type:complete len:250 (-) Transcript_135054:525-1274(-)